MLAARAAPHAPRTRRRAAQAGRRGAVLRAREEPARGRAVVAGRGAPRVALGVRRVRRGLGWGGCCEGRGGPGPEAARGRGRGGCSGDREGYRELGGDGDVDA